MIDAHGHEWLPIAEAARIVRVRVETIRVWRVRRKVQAVGEGRDALVHMPSLMAAEHAWRVRVDRSRRHSVT